MITKRTVFVLGAGASHSYGFPTGETLLRWVVDVLGRPVAETRQVQLLMELGHAERECREFANELSLAATASIDLFLESRQEFMAVGKAAIACGLIPYEEHSRLFPRTGDPYWSDPRPPSWYRYLIQRLGDTPEQFGENRLSIVTFNYDRSLEYFLFTAVKSRWKLSREEAAELVKTIPIVHVYGQLGKLPELAGLGQGRPYEARTLAEAIRLAVGEMQILHEADTNSPALTLARELLHDADRICFLGFGYHPTNLERLGVRQLGNSRLILGTAYGLLSGEKTAVYVAFRPNNLSLGETDEDVLLFIRNRGIVG
jgi:hypothetical protein